MYKREDLFSKKDRFLNYSLILWLIDARRDACTTGTQRLAPYSLSCTAPRMWTAWTWAAAPHDGAFSSGSASRARLACSPAGAAASRMSGRSSPVRAAPICRCPLQVGHAHVVDATLPCTSLVTTPIGSVSKLWSLWTLNSFPTSAKRTRSDFVSTSNFCEILPGAIRAADWSLLICGWSRLDEVFGRQVNDAMMSPFCSGSRGHGRDAVFSFFCKA